MLKDSLRFDDADREAIAAAVARAEEPAIVGTHGTGTTGETARCLGGKNTGKTVVLTGATRPFSLFASDGEFNLVGAVVAAQIPGAGVWSVMNAPAFPAARLGDNVEQGRFDISQTDPTIFQIRNSPIMCALCRCDLTNCAATASVVNGAPR